MENLRSGAAVDFDALGEEITNFAQSDRIYRAEEVQKLLRDAVEGSSPSPRVPSSGPVAAPARPATRQIASPHTQYAVSPFGSSYDGPLAPLPLSARISQRVADGISSGAALIWNNKAAIARSFLPWNMAKSAYRNRLSIVGGITGSLAGKSLLLSTGALSSGFVAGMPVVVTAASLAMVGGLSGGLGRSLFEHALKKDANGNFIRHAQDYSFKKNLWKNLLTGTFFGTVGGIAFHYAAPHITPHLVEKWESIKSNQDVQFIAQALPGVAKELGGAVWRPFESRWDNAVASFEPARTSLRSLINTSSVSSLLSGLPNAVGNFLKAPLYWISNAFTQSSNFDAKEFVSRSFGEPAYDAYGLEPTGYDPLQSVRENATTAANYFVESAGKTATIESGLDNPARLEISSVSDPSGSVEQTPTPQQADTSNSVFGSLQTLGRITDSVTSAYERLSSFGSAHAAEAPTIAPERTTSGFDPSVDPEDKAGGGRIVRVASAGENTAPSSQPAPDATAQAAPEGQAGATQDALSKDVSNALGATDQTAASANEAAGVLPKDPTQPDSENATIEPADAKTGESPAAESPAADDGKPAWQDPPAEPLAAASAHAAASEPSKTVDAPHSAPRAETVITKDQISDIAKNGKSLPRPTRNIIARIGAGDAQAHKELGKLMLEGKGGVKYNPALAKDMYEQAAALGNRQAIRDLAYLEKWGLKGFGPDEKGAVARLQEIASNDRAARVMLKKWGITDFTKPAAAVAPPAPPVAPQGVSPVAAPAPEAAPANPPAAEAKPGASAVSSAQPAAEAPAAKNEAAEPSPVSPAEKPAETAVKGQPAQAETPASDVQAATQQGGEKPAQETAKVEANTPAEIASSSPATPDASSVSADNKAAVDNETSKKTPEVVKTPDGLQVQQVETLSEGPAQEETAPQAPAERAEAAPKEAPTPVETPAAANENTPAEAAPAPAHPPAAANENAPAEQASAPTALSEKPVERPTEAFQRQAKNPPISRRMAPFPPARPTDAALGLVAPAATPAAPTPSGLQPIPPAAAAMGFRYPTPTEINSLTKEFSNGNVCAPKYIQQTGKSVVPHYDPACQTRDAAADAAALEAKKRRISPYSGAFSAFPRPQ